MGIAIDLISRAVSVLVNRLEIADSVAQKRRAVPQEQAKQQGNSKLSTKNPRFLPRNREFCSGAGNLTANLGNSDSTRLISSEYTRPPRKP